MPPARISAARRRKISCVPRRPPAATCRPAIAAIVGLCDTSGAAPRITLRQPVPRQARAPPRPCEEPSPRTARCSLSRMAAGGAGYAGLLAWWRDGLGDPHRGTAPSQPAPNRAWGTPWKQARGCRPWPPGSTRPPRLPAWSAARARKLGGSVPLPHAGLPPNRRTASCRLSTWIQTAVDMDLDSLNTLGL